MSIIKAIKDTIQGIPGKRSGHWALVRRRHIQSNPTCAVCGGTETLEVHHILPFHIDPNLEEAVINWRTGESSFEHPYVNSDIIKIMKH